MKTLITKSIILMTAGFLFSFNLEAKEKETPKTVMISETSKIIKEHIKFPNVLIHFNQEEKVNVVFTVNETGQVNLVIANTHMKLKLNQLKADNVVFNFKTI